MFLKKKRSKEHTKPLLKIESILVCTGVYNPAVKVNSEIEELIANDIESLSRMNLDDLSSKQKMLQKCLNESQLVKPDIIVNDVLDAVNYILKSF
jgi:hypothetical protein